MPIVARCWDPRRDGPSGGQIPAAATIFAICEELNQKKNERKIHILPAALPNCDRPGSNLLPTNCQLPLRFLKK